MEKTGSSKTTTGNIRAVRLNTYRERKQECIELEKECVQLGMTVTELQAMICQKNDCIKVLESQVEDQQMICSRFSDLEGEVVRVNSKLETTFMNETKTTETLEVVTESSIENIRKL